MRVIGIDPGLSGALAVIYTDDGWMDVWDLPVREVQGKTKTHRFIDEQQLALMVSSLSSGHDCIACVEQVSAMPSSDGGQRTMGATSAFNFGMGYGIIKGVFAGLHVPLAEVRPQTWKKVVMCGLGKEKDVSRELATKLFPKLESKFRRVKDDGRAEAMLIAMYHAIQSGYKF